MRFFQVAFKLQECPERGTMRAELMLSKFSQGFDDFVGSMLKLLEIFFLGQEKDHSLRKHAAHWAKFYLPIDWVI